METRIETQNIASVPVKRGRGRPPASKPSRRWEYATLASERPLSTADYNEFGTDGWELVCVYVRMDAVHAVFKREVV